MPAGLSRECFVFPEDESSLGVFSADSREQDQGAEEILE